MSGGGGGTTTTTSQPPQQFLNAYSNVMAQAQNVAGQPLNQYSGPMVAGFSPDQASAMGEIEQSQGIADPYINAGASEFGVATNPLYPTLQQFNPSSIAQYENPYTQAVTQATQGQFANLNAQQQEQLEGSEVQQGAFGGDRAAVAGSVLAGQQTAQEAPVLAGIESQGFTGAEQEFNTQQQTQLGAEEANSWLASQAGFGLANLGTTAENANLTGASSLLSSGGLQQQLEQEQLNIPYEQFLQQQAYPFQTTQFLADVAEGTGGAAGGTSSTTQPGPSTASQIGGGILTAAAIASMFKRGGGVQRKATGGGTNGVIIPQLPINGGGMGPLGIGSETAPNGVNIPMLPPGAGRVPSTGMGIPANLLQNYSPPPLAPTPAGAPAPAAPAGVAAAPPPALTGQLGLNEPTGGSAGNAGDTAGSGGGNPGDNGGPADAGTGGVGGFGPGGIGASDTGGLGDSTGGTDSPGPGGTDTTGPSSDASAAGSDASAGTDASGSDASGASGDGSSGDGSGDGSGGDGSGGGGDGGGGDGGGGDGGGGEKRGGYVHRRHYDDGGGVADGDSWDPDLSRGIAAAPQYGPPAPPPQASQQQGIGSTDRGLSSEIQYNPKPPANRYDDMRRQAMWTGLLGAGLGMLGGRSPNAGVNIGRGGLEGLQMYSRAMAGANQEQGREETMADKQAFNKASLSAHVRQIDQNAAQAAARLKEEGRQHDLQKSEADARTSEAAASLAEKTRVDTGMLGYRGQEVGVQRDKLAQENITTQPWEQPDPNDPTKTVSGFMRVPKTGGQPQFVPAPGGGSATSKGGKSGSATLDLAHALVQEGSAKNLDEALAKVHNPNFQQEMVGKREALAQSAAKAEMTQNGGADPKATFDKWRNYYGVPGVAAPAAAAPQQTDNGGFHLTEPSTWFGGAAAAPNPASGAPAGAAGSAQGTSPNGAGGQQAGSASGAGPNIYDEPAALAAAKQAIAQGAPRDAVIKRLQDHGFNPSGL